MAIDADGTVMLYYDTGVATELSAGTIALLNNEQSGGFGITFASNWVTAVFPEPRELDGIFTAIYRSDAYYTPSFGAVDTSGDTTNGIDGTWNNAIANINDYTTVYNNFRNNITSMAVATEKGVRARFNGTPNNLDVPAAFHLYGVISPGETPDRILFLDTLAADAVFTKPLDFGDVPRGQTQTRTFKIKNNSATLTINTIQVTAEDLYLNAGGWYEFGDDGISYQATFAVGNLGPGATKLLYLKQVIPDAETLGVQTGRIKVSHASLT